MEAVNDPDVVVSDKVWIPISFAENVSSFSTTPLSSMMPTLHSQIRSDMIGTATHVQDLVQLDINRDWCCIIEVCAYH